MNRPLVLLYNLKNEKGTKIRRMCLPLGIATRLVEPEEYGLPLGALVEGGAEQPAAEVEAFGEEMLLLVNLPSPLLDRFLQGFRRAKIQPVALKAVLTPTNSTWSSCQLRGELQREREAIAQGINAHREKEAGEDAQ